MSRIRLFALLLLLVAGPGLAGAAPEGKVVIAQGVDPSTLDMMNQQETPASNVGAQIFDTLYERDANLKIVPALAAEMPRLVAPTTWEVKLRKGVKFHNGEEFNADSVKFSLERVSNPANKLRGSSSLLPIDRVEIVDALHRQGPHQEALADLRERARLPPGRDVPAQGLRRQGHRLHLEEPDRHRALQVRPLVQGRGDRGRGRVRPLAGRPEDQDRRVPAHPRRRGAGGRAPERRDRRGRQHPAAPGRGDRQAPEAVPLHRAQHPHHPAHVLHPPDGRPAQGAGALRGAHRRQARAPGHRLCDRRRRHRQERARRQGHPHRPPCSPACTSASTPP